MIGIIGAGAFGYSLALLLGKAGNSVTVYDINKEYIDGINDGSHPVFFSDQKPPETVAATTNLEEVMKQEIIFLAVPGQAMRSAATSLKQYYNKHILVNTAKALELNSGKRMSEVIQECIPHARLVALSGGMIAADVATNAPVGAEIASTDAEALKNVQRLFLPTHVHVATTSDIIGVELAGAFKNVVAIGAGVMAGLALGSSSKAFYVAESLREVEALAVAMGAHEATFHTASHAWMGDLMTCCFGSSRNYALGEMIGQGIDLATAEETLRKQNKRAEGVATLKQVQSLIGKHKINAPFLEALYKVVVQGSSSELFRSLSVQPE